MRFIAVIPALLSFASGKSVSPGAPAVQHIFANPPVEVEGYNIPSVRESTAMARKIMHLTTIGDLVTVFPDSTHSNDVELQQGRPSDLAGSPIGLVEYYADCDPQSGNPIMLAINIATPFRNYAAGSNISLGVRWWPIQKNTYSFWADEEEIPTPHTPAALPRFSLHGHLEDVTPERDDYERIQQCFLRAHPDSKYWQPGNGVSHASHYVQLVVESVFWFGGFGDRARIEWLPIEGWRNFTMEEIIDAKLPGEKQRKSSWNLWS